MKAITKGICLSAAFSGLFLLPPSCEKVPFSHDGEKPSVSTGKEILCRISGGAEERTTLGTAVDGIYPVVWKNGDDVRLFSETCDGGEVYSTTLSEQSAGAVFTAVDGTVPASETRYAIYPAEAGIGYTEEGISVDFSGLRSQCIHTTLGNNSDNVKLAPLYASASAGNDEFVFSNLCGSVALRLNDYQGYGTKIRSITLTADAPVSGTGIVDDEGCITLIPDGEDSYSVTASAIYTDGQSFTASPATASTYKSCLFILPAGTYNQLRFDIKDVEGKVYSIITNRTVTVDSGINKSWPAIQLTRYWGSANCLMIEPGESAVLDVAPYYTFSSDYSYGGSRIKTESGENWLPDGLEAEVIWELAAGADASVSSSVLSSCSLGGTTLSVTAGSSEGNALVALKDGEGNIQWSFHVWVTDTPAELSYTNINGGILQDRDLGATNTDLCNTSNNLDCIGLHYQWGRKDPFATSRAALPSAAKTGSYKQASTLHTTAIADNTNGNIAWTIQNPTVRLIASSTPYRWYVGAQGTNSGEEIAFWGCRTINSWQNADAAAEEPNGVKTVYDPCPEGYKVTEAKYMTFVKGVNATLASPGFQVNYDGTNTNYWAPGGVFLHNEASVQYRGFRVCAFTATGNLNYPMRFYGYSGGITVQTSVNQGRACACTLRCRKEDTKTNTDTNLEEPEDE